MKKDYPAVGMEVLCRLFGKTRHAYYDHQWRQKGDTLQDEIILQLVHTIRKTLPRLGTRKLHHLLEPQLVSHGIEVGRDYLFDLLDEYKLLIRKRKRKMFTTDSRHWMRKYPNLTRLLVITRPEQLWVSDMTFIRVMNQWGYLSLITDAYSHMIMGYCFRSDMLAEGCVEALRMALANRSYGDQSLIHHSDRASQYCCKEYVKILCSNGIDISMTEKSDPYENALAERVNGIIKEEFNLYSSQANFEQTYQRIVMSIAAYNEVRPHSSCDYMTPCQAHDQTGQLKKRWKNYRRDLNAKQPDCLTEESGRLLTKSKPPTLQ